MTSFLPWSIVLALLAVLWFISPILPPFIIGLLLAYLCRPLVEYTEKRWKWPSFLGAFWVTLGIYAIFLCVIFLLIPSIRKITLFLSYNLHSYPEKMWNFVSPWIEKLSDYSQDVKKLRESIDSLVVFMVKGAGTVIVNIFSNSLNLIKFVITLLLAPVISFYVMKDWKSLCEKFFTLIPRRMNADIKHLLEKMGVSLSLYLRGQVLVCVSLALYYSTALYMVQADFAFLLGLGTGLGAFIPYLGFATGLISAVFISIFHGATLHKVLWILGVFLLGQVLESVALTPYLIGKKTGLHPVGVLFAVLTGGFLKGITGVFLALPVAILLTVIMTFLKDRYVNSTFYLEKKKTP